MAKQTKTGDWRERAEGHARLSHRESESAMAPYEALVDLAAKLVDVAHLADIDELDGSNAAVLNERNRLVLEAVRGVLTPRCCVPLRYERSYFAEHADDLTHLRNLARALQLEMLLAAARGDYLAATAAGIDILELANAVRRGGLIVDLLVGNAIAGIGMAAFCRMRGQLNEDARLLLIGALQRLENEREPLDTVYLRDQDWEQAVGYEEEGGESSTLNTTDFDESGLTEEEQQFVLERFQELGSLSESDMRRHQEDLDLQSLAMLRLLRIDVALRSCIASIKAIPRSLADLVPRYLPEVPDDPFTNDGFSYRQMTGGTFMLYGTGPKRYDGGGVFNAWPVVVGGGADLCLDVFDL